MSIVYLVADKTLVAQFLTFLYLELKQLPQLFGVGGGAAHLTNVSESILSLDACFFVFEVQSDRHSAHLTVSWILLLTFVVEFFVCHCP